MLVQRLKKSTAVFAALGIAPVATVHADVVESSNTNLIKTLVDQNNLTAPEKINLGIAKTQADYDRLMAEAVAKTAEEVKRLESQINDSKLSMDDYMTKVVEVETYNASKLSEYATQLAKYADKEAEYQNSLADYHAKKAEYDLVLAQYNIKLDKYNRDQAQFQIDTQLYEAAVAQYRSNMLDYESKKAAYDIAKAAYDSAMIVYNTDSVTYERDLAKYQIDIANYNRAKEEYDMAMRVANSSEAEYQALLRDYEAKKTQYDADMLVYATEKAQYDTALAAYITAKAKYESDLADYNVAKPLYDAAKAQYDTLKAQYDRDIVQYRTAKSEYDRLLNEYTTKKAQYDVAKAEYDTWKVQYDQDILKYKFDADVYKHSVNIYKDQVAAYEQRIREREAAIADLRGKIGTEGYPTEMLDQGLVFLEESGARTTSITGSAGVKKVTQNTLGAYGQVNPQGWRYGWKRSGTIELLDYVKQTPGSTTDDIQVGPGSAIGSDIFMVPVGGNLVVEYDNLTKSTFGDKQIAKVKYTYTANKASGQSHLLIMPLGDPTGSVYVQNFSANPASGSVPADQYMNVGVKVQFYDNFGNEITPSDKTKAVIAFGSLNRNQAQDHTLVEYASLGTGRFSSVAGSSITYHADTNQAHADNNNVYTEGVPHPARFFSAGDEDRATMYYGQANAVYSGPIEFSFGNKGVDILDDGGRYYSTGIYFAINTRNVPSVPSLLDVPKEPVAPIPPVSKEAPEIPVKPIEPTEPREPVLPKEPVRPTEPVRPEAPKVPVEPVRPSRTSTILTEPVKPSAPKEPVRPVTPEVPIKPVEPVKPTSPVHPEQPEPLKQPKAPIAPVHPELKFQPPLPGSKITARTYEFTYLPNTAITQWVEDGTGVELKTPIEGSFPDNDGVSDVENYTFIRTEYSTDGSVKNIYKKTPVKVEKIRLTKWVEEGTGVELKPSAQGSFPDFDGVSDIPTHAYVTTKTESPDDNTAVTVNVYKKQESVTTWVDESGKELKKSEVGRFPDTGESDIPGYVLIKTTETDTKVTNVYKRIVTTSWLLDGTTTKLQDDRQGSLPDNDGVSDITGHRLTTTTVSDSKVINYYSPLMTYWVDEADNKELKTPVKGTFPDNDGVSDISGYTLKHTTNDAQGNIVNVYTKNPHTEWLDSSTRKPLLPNKDGHNPDEDGVSDVKGYKVVKVSKTDKVTVNEYTPIKTHWVDESGKALKDPVNGEFPDNDGKSDIEDMIFVKTEVKDGDVYNIYKPYVTKWSNVGGDLLLPDKDGNLPDKEGDDVKEYIFVRTEVKDGVITNIYKPYVTKWVDDTGKELLPDKEGKLPDKEGDDVKDYIFVRTEEKDGVITNIYKPYVTKWVDKSGNELKLSVTGKFPDEDGQSDIPGYRVVKVEIKDGIVYNTYEKIETPPVPVEPPVDPVPVETPVQPVVTKQKELPKTGDANGYLAIAMAMLTSIPFVAKRKRED